MKLKHPHFSLRTIAILVTLLCAYYGAWEATKKHGVPTMVTPENLEIGFIVWSPGPCLICVDAVEGDPVPNFPWASVMIVRNPRYYYLWVFGPQFKLPFQTTNFLFPWE
jgi:hypothetical protein